MRDTLQDPQQRLRYIKIPVLSCFLRLLLFVLIFTSLREALKVVYPIGTV
jgi:hypothetical protein